MVEIALCLAIIGFALVAIIGVLPMGMNVQKENRDETIINQDAVVWMNAIRNGSRGYDDLTNHVLRISNYWTTFVVTDVSTNFLASGVDWYGQTNSSMNPPVPLTNCARIVGLLSTPKHITPPQFGRPGSFQSNYIIAYVLAMSGPAVEKFPQRNENVLENAFIYRMIVENSPYVPMDPSSIDLLATNGMSGPELLAHRRDIHIARNMLTNSHDLRITFRWPVFPTGEAGNNRQSFRVFTGGSIFETQDLNNNGQRLFYFDPSIYAQAQWPPP